MYRTLVRQAFRLGLLVTLVVFSLSACGGGGGTKDRAEEAATMKKTVAGAGGEQLGDDGPATKAGFCGTSDVALDHKGNIYICDLENQRIRKVDPKATSTTIASTGEAGFNREEGSATKVWLHDLIGLFVDDDSGVLYIGDTLNARIRTLRLEG